MKYIWSGKRIDYDGTQLCSLYNYLNHDVLGNSLLAFEGACSVSLDHMVDGEDKKALAKIEGSHMLHFLIEIFDRDLFSAVCLQRLFAGTLMEGVKSLAQEKSMSQNLKRCGDDIYFENKKLSISIATSSPVSQLIHFAVNVSNLGTPVETLSLEDLKVEPKKLADFMGEYFVGEFEDIRQATQKVHWVR